MRQRLWIGLGVVSAVVCAYVLLSKLRSPEPVGELTSGSGPTSSAAERKGQLPQALPFPEPVERELSAAWSVRASDYKPRTKHLSADGKPKYTNRLFLESSPYLLQHAHNPVNWFPWSEEAFEVARTLGRPILLSVGYSTCHWCHVMEEESFEDVEIAETLNRHYVAIKVDREERPDIDSIYMSAVRLLSRGGGWPMTVWLTADKTPFHGGSYFPARDGDRGSRVGFLTLLKELNEQYQKNPGQTVESATELALKLQRSLEASRPGGLPGADTMQRAMNFYTSGFDDADGGMRRAPKFPSNLPVRFLLRYHRRTGDAAALKMATLTLEKMAAGGIYDHVGGGFHRYSTDARWLVPHFEKMLYDNALLTVAYLEAYQATGNEAFAKIAREILRYVAREMTAPHGGFYSATDADSLTPGGQREEGWFFTWTPAELQSALGNDLARVARAYFAVREQGNFEGRSILHTPLADAVVAKALDIDEASLRSSIETIKRKLYEKRQERPAPLRDDKILTAWNGLMISAFARASLVLGDAESLAHAEKAAQFVLAQRSEGGLFRTFKSGSAQQGAYLDDYAFFIAALLDLYEASHEASWLEHALALNKHLEAHYADPAGGYFMTSDSHEALLAREKPSYDGAEPSGNSVQVLNLLRLYEFTTEERFRERAEATLRAFGGQLSNSASALSEMLLAVDFYLDAPAEILIVTPKTLAEAEPMLAELRRHFLPNKVLSVVSEGSTLQEHVRWVPMLDQKVARGGVTTAYVCERGACELPTSSPAVFAAQLNKLGKRSP